MTAVLPDRWLNELSHSFARPSSHPRRWGLRVGRRRTPVPGPDVERRHHVARPPPSANRRGDQSSADGVRRCPPGFDYDLREELLEALSFIIPVPLTHVSFTPSGSAAVDLAITWIASASHRPRLIAMERSDHGSGIGGRGASSGRRLGDVAGRSLEVVRVPFDDLDALSAQLDERRGSGACGAGPGRGGHPGAG